MKSIFIFSFLVVEILLLSVNNLQAADHALTLDINQYNETFSELFRGPLDVTPWGPSKWIAHTPWHGDFGDAQFTDPREEFPFKVGSDGLKIIAKKNDLGKWQSGLLSSRDSYGNGFSQSDGYFEVRMKLPPGPGVWPAFWLSSKGDDSYSCEIDVIEYYGQFPDGYHVTTHLWPKQKELQQQGEGELIHVPQNSLVTDYHTYGVEIKSKDIIFYLDRHEVKHMTASPYCHQPMSVLVNLALGSGWPIDKTPDPSVLEVDYIKVYSKK